MKRSLLSGILVAIVVFLTYGVSVHATEYDTTESVGEAVVEEITEFTTEAIEDTVITTEAVTRECVTTEDIAVTEDVAVTEDIAVTEEETVVEEVLATATLPAVSYSTHVSGKGWMTAVTNGEQAGTTGQARRIEAIKISVSGVADLGIRYKVHGQGYGWQGYACDGNTAGTTGQAKRMEAICIELTGSAASQYDVYYRVHSQTFGWLDWAKNGQVAGTYGLGRRMEAIQIVVVEKNGVAPGATANPCYYEENVVYQAHSQTYGWRGNVLNGAVAGVTGQAKRMEALRISLPDNSNLGVSYSAHVQSLGWTSEVRDGEIAGTIGQAKRVEAVKIKLTGSDAQKYDIWYRVHVQGYGWLGWAGNGEAAGSTGQARRIEAIQIRVLPKKVGAPGTTRNSLLSNSPASNKARQTLNRVGWNLKSAYDYSAGMKYYRNVPVAPSGQHLENYANYGFSNGCGNCYVMAATFCQMAREMGYEAYLVEGYVPSRRGGLAPHGWCEIYVDGRMYVCDPNFTNEIGGNGYMVNYGTSGTWRYSNYSRVN